MAREDLWCGNEFAFVGEVMGWAFSPDALDDVTLRSLEQTAQRVTIPRDYLLVDVETLGYGPQVPIVQVGWGVVHDAQLANVESLLLNWSLPDYGLDQRWVQQEILRVTRQMAEQGKRYCTTYTRMCQEGLDPLEVIEVYAKLINDYLASGGFIVGHNVWKFDRQRIDHHCQEFFGAPMTWPPNSILDTGLVEKAAQMNRPPYSGETLDAWYGRISGAGSRVKWNLEHHCVTKYKLAERFGIDPTLAHDAGHDCRMTYCLFETFRQIAEVLLGKA